MIITPNIQRNLMRQPFMRIAVSGTHFMGKSTLIEDMILQWPQLSKPERTYRDLVKEKNLPVNKDGTKESQGLILDFLVEEARKSYGKKKMGKIILPISLFILAVIGRLGYRPCS